MILSCIIMFNKGMGKSLYIQGSRINTNLGNFFKELFDLVIGLRDKTRYSWERRIVIMVIKVASKEG